MLIEAGEIPTHWHQVTPLCVGYQRAKKVVSISPGLVDFSIGSVIFVLNLPYRQMLFWAEIQITEGL